MSQQQLLFESSPLFSIVCLVLAVGGAALLYRNKRHQWSRGVNTLLFTLRTVLLFFLMVLLLGPVMKQINNIVEKPVIIFLQDNSVSVREAVDSSERNKLSGAIHTLSASLDEKGFETHFVSLNGEENPKVFDAPTSDIQGALKKITDRFEGKKIDDIVLISDGIYNTGVSPLYSNFNYKVSAIGIGDTTERADISIRNVAYNKIAYQGNRFPVKVEVTVQGYGNVPLHISLLKAGKVIEQQSKDIGSNRFLTFDFQPVADEAGLQRLEVEVNPLSGESNTGNNKATLYIEVVAGKKKILAVASAPHPDIKALHEVIDENPNYEFFIYIAGVTKWKDEFDKPDLAILFQVPDLNGKTTDLFKKFMADKTPLLMMLGPMSDLSAISKTGIFSIDYFTRQLDDVTPVLNPAFGYFSPAPDAPQLFNSFPPVTVHFGRIKHRPSAVSLAFQRVGNLVTENPLITVDALDDRKIGLVMGEGVYRWRLYEFSKNENTAAFDDVFSKLLQYMTTADERKRFKSYPIRQQFSDGEAAIFESQVYNDLFEPLYNKNIEIAITDETGKKKNYQYTTSPGSTRLELGILKEGVYKYTSSTDVDGKKESVYGEFLVIKQQIEMQNLTADFNMLRKLSGQTGGKFYKPEQVEQLSQDLLVKEASGTLHTEERFDSLINVKWIFFVLLTFIAVEWFVRRYSGSY